MAGNDPYGSPRAERTAREQSLEAQRNFWCLIAILLGFALVALVIVPRWLGSGVAKSAVEGPVARERQAADAPDDSTTSIRPQPPRPRAVPPAGSPSDPPLSAPPSSPGVRLRFDDLQAACGDLNYPNFLCLVNRGSEPIAGGARLVLTEAEASFNGRGTYNNGISISIEGKERYSMDFGPAKGRALLPGLYTGAVRWPFNEGPYPGMDFTLGSSGCNEEDGRFRILKIALDGQKVRQFVADFETTCNGGIGRVAVGTMLPGVSASPPIELRRHGDSPSN